jgi:membrane protein implicated in regulation of membrane protease activity
VVTADFYVYIALMVIGLALLLMALIGGGEHDVNHDIGGDVHAELGGGGHDVSADASGLSPVSLPMIATFLTSTGAMGLALNLGGTDPVWTALISALVGFIVFIGLFFTVVNFLVKAQASSLIHEKEYEGKTASVTETIPEEGIGAVAVTVRGMRQVVSARSSGRRITVGSQVLIKRVSESTAFVEELSDTPA